MSSFGGLGVLLPLNRAARGLSDVGFIIPPPNPPNPSNGDAAGLGVSGFFAKVNFNSRSDYSSSLTPPWVLLTFNYLGIAMIVPFCV